MITVNFDKLTPYQALFVYALDINLPVVTNEQRDYFMILDAKTGKAKLPEVFLDDNHFIDLGERLKERGLILERDLNKAKFICRYGATKIICEDAKTALVMGYIYLTGNRTFVIPSELKDR